MLLLIGNVDYFDDRNTPYITLTASANLIFSPFSVLLYYQHLVLPIPERMH